MTPGYLACLLPVKAPASPELFEHLMRDFEALILPGVRAHTRTVHPNAHLHLHSHSYSHTKQVERDVDE